MSYMPVQVSYLQNDNNLLENKQKELKGTIQSLLQSREIFINAYEVCVFLSSLSRLRNIEYTFIDYHLVEETMKMGRLVEQWHGTNFQAKIVCYSD